MFNHHQGNGQFAAENATPYEAKRDLYFNLSQDLESYLQRRFSDRYVPFSYSADSAANSDEAPYSVVPIERHGDFVLQVLCMANGAPALELTLKKANIINPDGEWSLSEPGKDPPVVFSHRFITQYIKSPERERKVESIAKKVLQDGDVLLTVDKAIEGWCTHPLGILLLREGGVYLNNNREKLDGELDLKPIPALEVIPSGIVYESTQAHPDILRLVVRDLSGTEKTIFAGNRAEVFGWRPHPEGAAIHIGNEVRVNGDTCIYRGPLSETWGVSSCGRIVTVSLSEADDRKLPGGKGFFRPASYASFCLEGAHYLYEAKYRWLESGTQNWHEHANVRMTGYGIFIRDSPEWRFFERYETWKWQQGLGITNDPVFGDEWSFFEILSECSSNKVAERSKFQPEASQLLWRSETASLFDWRPSIEAGVTTGIVVREGNSFVFHCATRAS